MSFRFLSESKQKELCYENDYDRVIMEELSEEVLIKVYYWVTKNFFTIL